MVKKHIDLSATDRKYLAGLTDKGQLRSRVFRRSTGLLELDRGKSLEAAATTLGVSRVTVARWRDGYRQKGLKCLEDAPRSGRPIKIDGHCPGSHRLCAFVEVDGGADHWLKKLGQRSSPARHLTAARANASQACGVS